jgi:hypothetical protein
MQANPALCYERVVGVTYDEGDIVCTEKSHDGASDNVYQCTTSRGCTGAPGVNAEWVLTRRLGTITEVIETVPAFDFEYDTAYAFEDYIVF